MHAQRQLGPIAETSSATWLRRTRTPPRAVSPTRALSGAGSRRAGERSSSAPPAPGERASAASARPTASVPPPRSTDTQPTHSTPSGASLGPRPALGLRRGTYVACGLGLNAVGAYVAYSYLIPRGVTARTGLLVGLAVNFVASVRDDADPDQPVADGAFAHLLRGISWTAAQLGQGAAWLLVFPGFRLASVPAIAGAALLGACVAPLTALFTRSCVRETRTRDRLAEHAAAWQKTGAQGPFGRLAWAVEGLAVVGTVGFALGFGPMVMVPATMSLLVQGGVRHVALGIAEGCAQDGPARDLRASFGLCSASCLGAATTVQLASVDWAAVGATLRRLVQP